MPALPDSVPKNGETVYFKKINAMVKPLLGIPKMIYEQFGEENIKKKISDSLWTVVVTPTALEEGLKMNVSCLGASNTAWTLTTSRLLLTFEDFDSTRNIVKSVAQREFNATNNTAKVSLTEEEVMYLVGDHCTSYCVFLKVSMTLEWSEQTGLEYLWSIQYDFHRRTDNSSLVIQIEDKRFFVNLEYLSQMSHYFHTLSKNLQMMPLDEATGLKLLKLDDVEWNEFEALLKLLYPSEKKDCSIDHKNLEALMKLADRFQCYSVQKMCAETMINMKKTCPAQLLWLCDFYNMDWNLAKLVGKLRMKQILEMMTTPEFQKLSQKTMKLIANRLGKLFNE